MNLIDGIHNDLHYDMFSGAFFWINKRSNKDSKESCAGCVQKNGYRHIIYKKKAYRACRLAWYFVHGEWPKGQIDHIDGNKINDSILNLRDLTPVQNQMNRKCHRDGILWGTSYHKESGTYASRVNLNGKVMSLGYHKTRQEAHIRSINFANKNGINLIRELKNV